MKNIRYFITDIFNIIQLRVKLLVRNKLLVIMTLLFFVVATFTISTFFTSAKDSSTIPIGIVDMDNSSHSKMMIANLKQNDLLKVTVIDHNLSHRNENNKYYKKEIINRLKKKEINAAFVIKEGFGENIENNNFENIIDDYYVSNQKYAKIISDIVLSSILDDVCYHYSQNKYYSLQNKLNKVYTKEQYKKKITKIYDTNEDSIGFDFDVVNVKDNKSVNDNMNSELIYREVVIGITALIIMILCLLVGNLIVDDYKNKVLYRSYITNMSSSTRLLGDILSMWTIICSFVIVLSIMLLDKIGLDNLEKKLKFLLIILLFAGTISLLYVLVTRIVNDIVLYQMYATIIF